MKTRPPGVPWLTDGANAVLDRFVTPEMVALEFGAGGSTVWLSNRCRLATIEDDRRWYDSNADKIRPEFSELIVQERPYYRVANRWQVDSFDLVLIDGRERVGCALHSMRLVKPGGLLIVDNCERKQYRPIGETLCKGWKRTDYEQTEPNSWGFWYPGWLTTIWEKAA